MKGILISIPAHFNARHPIARIAICFFLLMVTGQWLYAQKTVTITGMVVDSTSLVAIPSVHISSTRTNKGTVVDAKGNFRITTVVFDTLVFTSIGYKTLQYLLLVDEEDILIRLTENVIILPELTTQSTRLQEKVYAERAKVVTPSLAEGIGSPFTYFSKKEKEKRTLIKVREENVRIRTYVEVVNDPEFKQGILADFSISEEEYHKILVKFNTVNRQAQYLSSESEIIEQLTAFFRIESRR
ncbi:MAG: carboxypeptidase-like regulatory domain-containing protein [Cyclobacteriaceae bacterium]|nr:carboxypeptidase-like regulatory domain-containing protein [Cyclobacteriaceae bacterium]